MTTSSSRAEAAVGHRPGISGRRELVGILVRGAVGGLIAGMLFAVMTMWMVVSVGMPMKMPLLAIATIVQGGRSLATGDASPALGAGIHMVLSMLFGVILALLVRRLRREAVVMLLGAGYGLLLYVVNFVALGNAAFAVFTRLNQPFQVLNHIVFGVVVALVVSVWRWARA